MQNKAKTPLEAAFETLSPFVKRKLKGPILYHYTTLATFAEFVKDDAKLYCTHYAALNDSSELTYGISVICEQLETKFGVPHGQCEQFKRCFDIGRSSGQIKPTWIMSFSLERDSLYQWGMYTDRQQGGYSIGLDANRLKQIVGDYNDSCSCPISLYLLPCLYRETNRNEIDLFLKALFGSDKVVKMLESHFWEDADAAANILARMVLAACLIKHESFAYENEVRLIVPPTNKSYENVSFIEGKPRWNTRLFPYEEEPLRSIFREIWISPHGSRKLLKSTAEVLILKYGLKVGIKESDSPYNGR